MQSEVFENYLQDPENSLVEKAIEQGRIPVGYTCSLVPEVLLSIPPLFPVRMRAPGVGGTEIADIYLSNLTCSYTRSLLEMAMDFRYDFLAGWVNAASCDHLRRFHDNLEYLLAPGFAHILDVPHRAGEEALAWFTQELKHLLQSLEQHFDLQISNQDINRAITEHNSFLQLLAEIAELRQLDNPPISGTDFSRLMLAAITTPRDLVREDIVQFRQKLSQKQGIENCRARVMIIGGQLDDPDYISAIESTGALVVADRVCTGSIPGLEPIELGNDPIGSVAAHTLTTPSCPRMMEDFDKRLDQILETARKYKVDAIIIQFIKFCDVWGVETGALGPALKEQGYPVLTLEREYHDTGVGQLQTRVQAFLESMGR
ncbi:MAG: 2-hydroxyacyl-CoA dehydratase subunit D [Thermodesulfobacteriota bacterium]